MNLGSRKEPSFVYFISEIFDCCNGVLNFREERMFTIKKNITIMINIGMIIIMVNGIVNGMITMIGIKDIKERNGKVENMG